MMSCQLPRLNKLFCFSLETGCLAIAWLFLITSSLQLATISIFYSYTIQYVEYQLSKYTDMQEKESVEMNVYVVEMVVGLVIVGMCFAVIINTLLLLGVYKRNTCLMLPWILIYGISVCMSLFSGIATFLTSIYSFHSFLSAIWLNLYFAIIAYIYLAVYSFYTQLKEERSLPVYRLPTPEYTYYKH